MLAVIVWGLLLFIVSGLNPHAQAIAEIDREAVRACEARAWADMVADETADWQTAIDAAKRAAVANDPLVAALQTSANKRMNVRLRAMRPARMAIVG